MTTSGGGEAPPDAPAPPAPVAGAVAAGVATGVVALLAGLLVAPVRSADPAELTRNGNHNLRPELDAAVYFAAAALAVAASVLLSRRRSARAGDGRPAPGAIAPWLPAVVPAVAVAVATAVFVAVRGSAPVTGAARAAWVAAALALAGACWGAARAGRAGGAGPSLPWAAPVDVPAGGRRLALVDLLVPLVLALFLWTPGWRELAGNAVAGEGALHLDFFALGPGLAFDSGQAFGTEVHPYYGVGWSMLFSRLDLLSYGELLRAEVVYGCVYFTGVYLLVRRLTGDRRWAVAGTVAALLLQMFAGWPDAFVLWRFPSATVLRWPFDVWLFLACLAERRTGRPSWSVVGGALVGLAVVFQTETAVALGLALGFWWAARWRSEGRAALRAFPAAAAAGAAVVVAGLGMASRWTLDTGAFWSGWLENVGLAARGATLLPIVGLESTGSVVAFVAVTAIYLAFVCLAVVRVVRRTATTAAVMLGAVALYGLVTFLYFVGRSNPHNLFRPTVPLAVAVTSAAGLAWRRWADARGPSPAVAVVPWAAVAVAVAALLADPGARAYPGLLRSALTDDRVAPGVCLVESPRDVCGLPPEFRGLAVADLWAVADRLRLLGASGVRVAVVDEIGPVIPYLAGSAPWGRYSPLFPTLFTQEQRRAVLDDLAADPPPLLVMRTRDAVDAFYADSWEAFRPAVERGFVLDSRHGAFEIWRRAG